MKVAFNLLPNAPHQVEHGKALEEGLKACGVKSFWNAYDTVPDADIMAIWTWRQTTSIAAMLDSGRHVLVLERGFLQPRMEWCSLAIDGLNGRGRFAPAQDRGKRFKTHFGKALKPWRKVANRRALVIGQVPGDCSLRGLNPERWAQDITQELCARGYSVRYRPHPTVLKRQFGKSFVPMGAQWLSCPLEEDLAAVEVCVTYSSNTAVDAVLFGTPTIALDEGSMAWAVTSHSLDDPLVRPDRRPWCRDLAWRQWTLDELRSGAAWKAISKAIP